MQINYSIASALMMFLAGSQAQAHSDLISWPSAPTMVALSNFNVPGQSQKTVLYPFSLDSEHPQVAEFFYSLEHLPGMIAPTVDVYLHTSWANMTDVLIQKDFRPYSTDCSCYRLDVSQFRSKPEVGTNSKYQLIFRNDQWGINAPSPFFKIDKEYETKPSNSSTEVPLVKFHTLDAPNNQAYTSKSLAAGRFTTIDLNYPTVPVRFTYSKGYPGGMIAATVDVYLCNPSINMTDILLASDFNVLVDGTNEFVLDLATQLKLQNNTAIRTSDKYQLMIKHREGVQGWGPTAVTGYFGFSTGGSVSGAESAHTFGMQLLAPVVLVVAAMFA